MNDQMDRLHRADVWMDEQNRIDMMNDHLQEVVSQIKALRKLTAQQGIVTKRTQNTLLASLRDDELAIVAVELAKN